MITKTKYTFVFTAMTISILLTGSLFPVMEAAAKTAPGTMIGSAGNNGPNPGSIFMISQNFGTQTFIGDPTNPGGVSGLAFDDQFRLWGSNVFSGGSNSNLLQINPDDGTLINDVGPILDAAGDDLKIQDLAYSSALDQLFGTTSSGDLVTINRSTAAATLVGALPSSPMHIGFSPTGVLWGVDRSNSGDLFTLDPTNANVLTQVARSPTGELDALGVDPKTGVIWVARTNFQGLGEEVNTINSAGIRTVVGSGLRVVSDIAFVPLKDVGGELLLIDTTALALAGLQSSAIWMLPVLAGAVGVGAYYIKTRMNKE